jgi:hypothetical protein
MLLVECCKFIGAAEPKNYVGAVFAGRYVSLKMYDHATIVIHTGAWAAGTAAVTLSQATDVSGNGAKALSFPWMWTGTVASGLLTKTPVVSNTFDLAAANAMYVIELEDEWLDINAANPFDCLSVLVASPGANADLYNIDYILSEPSYAAATPPSAIID